MQKVNAIKRRRNILVAVLIGLLILSVARIATAQDSSPKSLYLPSLVTDNSGNDASPTATEPAPTSTPSPGSTQTDPTATQTEPASTATPSLTPTQPDPTGTPTATGTMPSQPWERVFAIPGHIEAEDYRSGGQGVGYSDSDSGNNGGAYRNNDVDIEPVQDSGGGYNVGWIVDDEWLAYDVHVQDADTYRATVRVAAPAGGARFHLEIDGIDVSGSVDIPATGNWQNWTDVAVSMDLPDGNHVMRFVAETSGFNVNYYTFAPVTAPEPSPEPSPATETVDAGVMVNPFRPEMLGVAHVNWEHSWGKPFSSQVPGLAQAYEAAGIRLVRYAGGLWSNDVGWERLPQRTPYTSWHPDRNNYSSLFADQINTAATYSFHYGQNEIDDLAAFSDAAGVEIIIQANVVDYDPAMWADLVHYANVEHDYDFKYWEIGNELDHDTGAGISPDEYASRLAGYIDAMKAVDPDIAIIGGVPASGHDFYRLQDWSGATTGMSLYLHESADLTTPGNRRVDSLSYHWYQNCNNASVSDMTTYAFEDVPYTAWQNVYSRNWSQIGASRMVDEVIAPTSSDIPFGITELNYDACDFGVAPQNSNHMAAIWAADGIGRLAYNGLDFLTWYEGYGTQGQGYPMVYSTPNDMAPTGVVLRPTYYAFFMYGNYFGDQMVESSATQNPAIAIYASTDSQVANKLKLMVVNLSSAPVEETIGISNFAAANAEAYVMANPNPTDMSNTSNTGNGGTTINGIVLQDDNVAASAVAIQPIAVTVSGNSVTHTFAPYSVTAIIVNGN